MNKVQKLFFAMAFGWPAGLFSQTSIFVSPGGNDANRGTQAQPFASIARAMAERRKTSGSAVIYLLEGTYYLNKPLVFAPGDIGKENETLAITSYKNQKVIISGAAPLNLKWEKYKNGIWKASVKQDLIFDELMVNGQLQRMARYPNYDSTARFLGGTDAGAFSKERVATWHSPAGGYIHALHRSEWGDFHYIITGKNSKGELNYEGGWQNNRRMGMHERYRFVENIFEELDTVNEWFYDKQSRTLYYYPPENVDVKTAKFETPQMAHLFEFKGTEKNR